MSYLQNYLRILKLEKDFLRTRQRLNDAFDNQGGFVTADLEVNGALNHDGTTAGFFNVTPVIRPTAPTAADAGTVDATYGAEEAAVINNLRTRQGEIETKLRALGLLT